VLGELEDKVLQDRNANTTLPELLCKAQRAGLWALLMTFTEPPLTPCDWVPLEFFSLRLIHTGPPAARQLWV